MNWNSPRFAAALALAAVTAVGCNRDNVRDDTAARTTAHNDHGAVTSRADDHHVDGTGVKRDHDLDRRHDDKDHTGTTTTTGARIAPMSNESAIDRIVAARCQRESTCNNVGADKHFASNDVCTRELRSKIKDDLKASECPRGVDAKELDECMESIKKESCNNPLDTLSRLAACRTSDMCLKVDDKNR